MKVRSRREFVFTLKDGKKRAVSAFTKNAAVRALLKKSKDAIIVRCEVREALEHDDA